MLMEMDEAKATPLLPLIRTRLKTLTSWEMPRLRCLESAL